MSISPARLFFLLQFFLINTTPLHQVKAFVHDLDKGLKKLQVQ